MSIRPAQLFGVGDSSGGYVVVCDGCGMGLQFLLDDDPRNEIDTEQFASLESAARSAVNRGWSVEPPDGKDGAYCPECVMVQ